MAKNLNHQSKQHGQHGCSDDDGPAITMLLGTTGGTILQRTPCRCTICIVIPKGVRVFQFIL